MSVAALLVPGLYEKHLTFGLVSGAADAISPTFSSASINTAGDELTLNVSENVTLSAMTGISLTASGGAVTATYSSGSGSSAIVATLSRVIQQGETVTVTHVPVLDEIQDGAGNDLVTFSGESVTNGSTYAPPVLVASPSSRNLVVDVLMSPIALSAAFEPDGTSYSLVSGTLPTGLSLNTSTGQITGTPTVLAQVGTLVFRATNASGTADTSSVVLTVIESTGSPIYDRLRFGGRFGFRI